MLCISLFLIHPMAYKFQKKIRYVEFSLLLYTADQKPQTHNTKTNRNMSTNEYKRIRISELIWMN